MFTIYFWNLTCKTANISINKQLSGQNEKGLCLCVCLNIEPISQPQLPQLQFEQQIKAKIGRVYHKWQVKNTQKKRQQCNSEFSPIQVSAVRKPPPILATLKLSSVISRAHRRITCATGSRSVRKIHTS